MAYRTQSQIAVTTGTLNLCVLTNISYYTALFNVGQSHNFTPSTAPVVSYGTDIWNGWGIKNFTKGQSVRKDCVDGKYIVAEYSQYNQLDINFYNSNNTILASWSNAWGNLSRVTALYIMACIDEQTQNAIISVVQYRNDNIVIVGSYFPSTNTYNAYLWLKDTEPTIGNYYPVANLYSVNGNTPLSMIKHEYNNHGESTAGDIDRVERLTFQSDIKAVFDDMIDGETRLLYYCGDNRVFITRHGFELRATDFYVYKFSLSYSFGGQPTDGDMTHRYETNINIGDKAIYFGFWVDETQGLAQPCVIIHDVYFGYEHNYYYNWEYTSNKQTLQKFYRWLSSYGDTPEKPNPFEDNPQNNEASGGENFRPRGNENIPFNTLPTKSGITAHLFTVYNPSENELVRFADYLWSDDFLDNFKKLFQNPIDCVIGLAMIPCTIPADSKTSARIYAGNVDTLISSSKVINRFVTLDMGTLEISPVWDGYLDFSPYTKIEIYLPFCGSHSLDTDDIVQAMTSNDRTGKPKTGTTLHLRYVIDVVTGCCVAQIEVYPTGTTGDASVHYQFTGNCSIELPLASASYNNLTSSLVQTAGSIISTIATKGATAPMLAGNVMSTVANLKPEIQKTGANTSVFGMLSENIPYVTITEPITAYSRGENLYKGFPSYMTKQLNTCTGYTKVFDVHLDDIVCTDTERDEIYRLLKGGVIL